MEAKIQLLLDLKIFKAFSAPASTASLVHNFRVGAAGTDYFDITTDLDVGQTYSLRHNFTTLVIKTSSPLTLTFTEITEEDAEVFTTKEVTLRVVGFTVITNPLASFTLRNDSSDSSRVTLIGS